MGHSWQYRPGDFGMNPGWNAAALKLAVLHGANENVASFLRQSFLLDLGAYQCNTQVEMARRRVLDRIVQMQSMGFGYQFSCSITPSPPLMKANQRTLSR